MTSKYRLSIISTCTRAYLTSCIKESIARCRKANTKLSYVPWIRSQFAFIMPDSEKESKAKGKKRKKTTKEETLFEVTPLTRGVSEAEIKKLFTAVVNDLTTHHKRWNTIELAALY